MGLQQGPRLMACTTKSSIRGNHWVPLGCRALLGSVNIILALVLQSEIVLESSEIGADTRIEDLGQPDILGPLDDINCIGFD
jgi:hypothetical protein